MWVTTTHGHPVGSGRHLLPPGLTYTAEGEAKYTRTLWLDQLTHVFTPGCIHRGVSGRGKGTFLPKDDVEEDAGREERKKY